MNSPRNVALDVRLPARLEMAGLLASIALGCLGCGGESASDESILLRAESASDDPAGARDGGAERDASDGEVGEPRAYPWGEGECDSVHVLRAHSGVDETKPYIVQPEVPVSPQFLFDAPWAAEYVKAVAFHPLIDNEAVIKDWYLYDSGRGTQLAGWQRGRAFAPWPRSDLGDLPRGPRSLRLDVHYQNKASTPATDRSGVAICVKAAFGATEPK